MKLKVDDEVILLQGYGGEYQSLIGRKGVIQEVKAMIYLIYFGYDKERIPVLFENVIKCYE